MKISLATNDVDDHLDDLYQLRFQLTKKIVNNSFQFFFQEVDSATRANMLSNMLPHAYDTLSASPVEKKGLEMSPYEFVLAL